VSDDHAHDLRNIAYCDRTINSYRSDLKLGDEDNDRYRQHENWDNHVVPMHQGGEIDYKKRIYYPSNFADKGLLARSITRLLFRYPYLYSYLHEIIDYPETLAKWSSEYQEHSTYEKWRERQIKGRLLTKAQ
jgi:hypothetical protein